MKLSLIFFKEISQAFCLIISLNKMLKLSSFLPASPEALAPLGNSTRGFQFYFRCIDDNPLIQSRPHTRPRSSHIMAPKSSEESRFESCRLKSVKREARASQPDTNP